MRGMFSRFWTVTAVVAALAAGTVVAGPADAGAVSSYNTPVVWAGQTWLAKNSPVVQQGPAPNYWLASPENLYTDTSGRLHLIAKEIQGRYYCAEVETQASDFGYGTYRFVIDTPLEKLDPMAVVGMFTYNDNIPYSEGSQEIDVELSRWGQPSLTANNSQYVVQPWRQANHILRFPAPTQADALTYEFTWKPTGVVFKLRNGAAPNSPVLKKWKTAPPGVGAPQSGTRVHLNMWLYRGEAPYNKFSQEVIFQDFTYTPSG